MNKFDKLIQCSFSPETGKSICTIKINNNEFIGVAQCHPDDMDMMSELTGQNIAKLRAIVKCYQHHKNNVLRPQLQSLRHLKSLYENNSKCNINNYEFKLLSSQIYSLEQAIKTTKEYIYGLQKDISNYINMKDSFYIAIRRKRGQKQLNQTSEISD